MSKLYYDFIIAGSGIVGLATAFKLSLKRNFKILILEKEVSYAMHQTGNNSGVIHSGIYYKPGSKKALNCKSGYDQLLQFSSEMNINYEICGKLVIATKENQLESLKKIYERGVKNNLKGIKILNKKEALKIEPYATNTLKAIYVPQAGIIDYKQVSKKLLEQFQKNGGEIIFNNEVKDVFLNKNQIEISTNSNQFKCKYFINCCGLYSDKISDLTQNNTIKIIPFRGEYYNLKNDKKYLVKNLIYPVPDINLPFLGVHFTRRIDGVIEAGPNAVLAFKKEGYNFFDFNINEFFETIRFSGFRKLGYKYFNYGLDEMKRSLSKDLFVKSLKELIPEIKKEDVEKGGSGVRAQACDKDGNLIDDFLITKNNNIINVINAPSPAATSCLSIADEIIKNI